MWYTKYQPFAVRGDDIRQVTATKRGRMSTQSGPADTVMGELLLYGGLGLGGFTLLRKTQNQETLAAAALVMVGIGLFLLKQG